jgi:hypothetical protein
MITDLKSIRDAKEGYLRHYAVVSQSEKMIL